jgi:hypothetical protein
VLCQRCQQEIKHPIDQFEGYCHNCEDWTTPGPLGLITRAIHFNRQGEPIPLSVWMMLIENQMDRIVQQDTIDTDDGPVLVSTVWIGLDMSFDVGSPLIFETMIFGGKYDQHQERYPNEEAALAGHDQALALVRHTAHAK